MRALLAALLLVVAVISGGSIVLLVIGNMMTPGAGPSDGTVVTTLGLIAAVTAIGLAMAFKFQPAASTWWLIGACVLVVAVALPPHVFDWNRKAIRSAEIRAEQRAYQTKFLADLETRKQDVEARAAARRPYTPEEADALVAFVRRSNLSHVQGPNHMPAAMALLQHALEAKLIDPNAPVKDWVSPQIGQMPLYLRLHRELRQVPERTVLSQDWNILLLLIAHGADLSAPRAEPLAADLRKTATPVHGGLYLELK